MPVMSSWEVWNPARSAGKFEHLTHCLSFKNGHIIHHFHIESSGGFNHDYRLNHKPLYTVYVLNVRIDHCVHRDLIRIQSDLSHLPNTLSSPLTPRLSSPHKLTSESSYSTELVKSRQLQLAQLIRTHGSLRSPPSRFASICETMNAFK